MIDPTLASTVVAMVGDACRWLHAWATVLAWALRDWIVNL